VVFSHHDIHCTSVVRDPLLRRVQTGPVACVHLTWVTRVIVRCTYTLPEPRTSHGLPLYIKSPRATAVRYSVLEGCLGHCFVAPRSQRSPLSTFPFPIELTSKPPRRILCHILLLPHDHHVSSGVHESGVSNIARLRHESVSHTPASTSLMATHGV
jgi:hypothetical protein